MDIVDKIRVLQGERDWTDYTLAKKANIPYSSLATIFSSKRNSPPKIDMLQSICDAFGLTLSQFFLNDEQIEILSVTEKAMLDEFRKLSTKKQQALIDLLSNN